MIYDDNKLFIAALSCKGREIWIEKLQSKEEGNSWLGAKVKEAILIIIIMHGYKDISCKKYIVFYKIF